MLEWCVHLLRAAGAPLHYQEITKRMLDGGYHSEGRTPAQSVNATLSRRRDLFRSLGRGYYSLVAAENEGGVVS
jgi:hypothetical protein